MSEPIDDFAAAFVAGMMSEETLVQKTQTKAVKQTMERERLRTLKRAWRHSGKTTKLKFIAWLADGKEEE